MSKVMASNVQQHEDQPERHTYPDNGIDFAAAELFGSKFDMTNPRSSDMYNYSFDSPSGADNGMPSFALPISPSMPATDMFFDGSDRPMHIDPAATWNGSEGNNVPSRVGMMMSRNPPGETKFSTGHEDAVSRRYGQITPPSENDRDSDQVTGMRTDSGVGQCKKTSAKPRSSSHSQQTKRMASADVRPAKRARRDSRASGSEDDEDGLLDHIGGDGKREKYREKNRVAAAKCRAKKKEHVDHLEETHRTQSVLNTALKQTEKALRDELSFWRTQALQHTFCNCRSVQEYNMRKARSLAVESVLGNPISNYSPSMKSTASLSMASPAPKPCEVHIGRSQSVSGVALKVSSPETISAVLEARSMSFATPLSNPSDYKHMSRSHSQRTSESAMHTPTISGSAEQDLKDFVGDVV